MSVPTWSSWPATIAAQNVDVESTAPCLYRGRWDGDDRTWIPEVYDTGIVWETCAPEVEADAEFTITEEISHAKQSNLWTPVGEEDTKWTNVQYPN
jgi:hypothetical protein